MKQSIKDKALLLEEKGDSEGLYQLMLPYLEKEDPFALHMCASTSRKGESIAEFTERYVLQMTKASEGGISRASYQMGVNHLYGDDVPQDYKKASMYFDRAISQGHSYTKFTYGFSLYYGNDGNVKDEAKGLSLMREAAQEGIDKSVKELELINDSK